jgi:hypothetical protein
VLIAEFVIDWHPQPRAAWAFLLSLQPRVVFGRQRDFFGAAE